MPRCGICLQCHIWQVRTCWKTKRMTSCVIKLLPEFLWASQTKMHSRPVRASKIQSETSGQMTWADSSLKSRPELNKLLNPTAVKHLKAWGKGTSKFTSPRWCSNAVKTSPLTPRIECRSLCRIAMAPYWALHNDLVPILARKLFQLKVEGWEISTIDKTLSANYGSIDTSRWGARSSIGLLHNDHKHRVSCWKNLKNSYPEPISEG